MDLYETRQNALFAKWRLPTPAQGPEDALFCLLTLAKPILRGHRIPKHGCPNYQRRLTFRAGNDRNLDKLGIEAPLGCPGGAAAPPETRLWRSGQTIEGVELSDRSQALEDSRARRPIQPQAFDVPR